MQAVRIVEVKATKYWREIIARYTPQSVLKTCVKVIPKSICNAVPPETCNKLVTYWPKFRRRSGASLRCLYLVSRVGRMTVKKDSGGFGDIALSDMVTFLNIRCREAATICVSIDETKFRLASRPHSGGNDYI